MKTVEIIYRYEARDTSARPLPSDSDAALLRLNDGNRDFATLLDHVKDGSGVIQQIIPVDPRDLGLSAGAARGAKATSVCRRARLFGCSRADRTHIQ